MWKSKSKSKSANPAPNSQATVIVFNQRAKFELAKRKRKPLMSELTTGRWLVIHRGLIQMKHKAARRTGKGPARLKFKLGPT